MSRGVRKAVLGGVLAIGAAVLYPLAGTLAFNQLYDTVKDAPKTLWAIVVGVALVGGLTALLWELRRRQELREQFGLYCKSERLRPEDMGFEVVQAGGDTADILRRPYVPGTYVSRTAIPWDERYAASPSRTYHEASLLAELREGHSFLLVGRPTEGKTRTLLEIVRQLHGWYVVHPKNPPPSDDAMELLRGKDVVCLFDDINLAQEKGIEVTGFCERVAEVAARRVVAAGCRDGNELAAMEAKLIESPLQRLYAGFHLRLQLVPATPGQLRALASSLGGDPERSYFSLGNVSMKRFFRELEPRFRSLSAESQECFWALQLLAFGGVRQLTGARVSAVLNTAFRRPQGAPALLRSIRELADNGFVTSRGDVDPIVPEAALNSSPDGVRLYREGQSILKDEPALLTAMLAEEDLEGANDVAVSRYYRSRSSAPAGQVGDVDGFLKVVEHFRNSAIWGRQSVEGAKAFNNAGSSHGQYGRPDEALGCYREVIKRFGASTEPALQQQVARALNDAGFTHVQQGLHDEALGCFREVIKRFGASTEPALQAQLARALYHAGLTHRQQDRPDEALGCFREVIERFGASTEPAQQEPVARALYNAGLIHGKQDRPDEALACYRKVIERFGASTVPGIKEFVERARARLPNSNDQRSCGE